MATDRERIGACIAYATNWTKEGLDVRTTMRAGGSVWITLADGTEYQIVVREGVKP